jgi:DNA-binding beta-propeller fold protein YncE
MRNGTTLGVGVLALAVIAGCGDPSVPVDYEGIETIVYTEHVQPILDASCAVSGCHTGTDPAIGLDLSDYDGLVAGSHHGSVAVPFHPDRSHLYLHVSGQVPPRMPLDRAPLPDTIVEFLGRWIDGGAPFDDGVEMYSGVTRKAFVACQGDNLVAVLDMDPETIEKGRVVRLLSIRAPHSVYVDEPSGRLYVSRFELATDNIHVYDADTYELLDTAQAGTFPALLMVTPDGSQLWVTNFDSGANPDHAVRVFDPSNLSQGPIAVFNLPAVEQPHGLAMTADGSLVFITNILSSNVSVYVTNIPTGPPTPLHMGLPLPGGGAQQPQQCVLSDDETRLFVSALGANKVHVLDVTGVDQPGWTPRWGTSADVGQAPWHLALSPTGDELWVANWVDESVTVLSVTNPDQPSFLHTLRPSHPFDHHHGALKRPMGIGFSPDGNLVYVTSTNDTGEGMGHHPPPEGQKNPGNVTIFDAATKEIVAVPEVPNFARFISFLP